MKFGITGLPKTGKTTVFNLLTGSNCDTSKFSASVEDIHRGVAKVPDERLDKLADLFKSKKKVPVGLDLMDFAGLALGSERESKLVGDLRTIDAIIHVLRAFEDEELPHASGEINPLDDATNFLSELIINDLMVVEAKLERVTAQLGKVKTDEAIKEKALFEKVKEHLENETPLRDVEFDPNEEIMLRGYGLLSMKPLLFALNIGEDDASELDKTIEKYNLSELAADDNMEICPLCAQIEEEISKLDDDEEKEMFMTDLGLTELGSTRLMQTAYRLLNLITFFTGSEIDAHAWTIPAGSNAVKAAGAIHSDIARGFIRAEVIKYDDLIEAGSVAEVKNKGAFRLEGKEYEVQDGDYIVVRFNV